MILSESFRPMGNVMLSDYTRVKYGIVLLFYGAVLRAFHYVLKNNLIPTLMILIFRLPECESFMTVARSPKSP
jgi:hypothetical protein